jgi:hypothetical protein
MVLETNDRETLLRAVATDNAEAASVATRLRVRH